MYGVMAGQSEGGARPRSQRRDQSSPDNDNSRRLGLKNKLLQYVRRKMNPPEEEAEVAAWWAGGGRHRPEPPAALAAHTRFTQHEIKLMYRGFKQECPTGVVDEDAFKNIFCQFFPLGDATQYAHLVFNSIKHKHHGKVNFEEFLRMISVVGRGSAPEQLQWVFSLYDADGDGRISRAELGRVVSAVYELLGESRAHAQTTAAATPEQHADRIFHLMDSDRDGWVSASELAAWCQRSDAARASLRQLDTVL